MAPAELEQYKPEILSCRLLEDLNSPDIVEMGKHVRIEDFSEGDDILTEGNEYQGLWLILRGQCSVVKKCDEQESVLATLEQGNVFGEMSFFEHAPHSATVRAVRDVKALCLTRAEFEKLRLTCPSVTEKIAIAVVKLLSDRLRRMDGWTCELVASGDQSQHHKEWHEFRARLYSDVFD